MNIYQISTLDGSYEASKKKWTEAMLEHALALCPSALGAENALPVILNGGSTAMQPDQLYIDKNGRCIVVELKSGRADTRGLMQLLAYADHWRTLPLGELQIKANETLASAGAQQPMEKSLTALRQWTGATHTAEATTPFAHLPAIGPQQTVHQYIKTLKKPPQWTLAGMSPRCILAAPSFSEEVEQLTHQLNERGVSVELVTAELSKTPDNHVQLHWVPFVCKRPLEQVWEFTAQLMSHSFVAEHFAINGWADHLARSSFSLSAKAAPTIKFWIDTCGKDNQSFEVSTALPDRWKTTSERKKIRDRFLDTEHLPKPEDEDRWIVWGAESARQHGKTLVRTSVDVMKVIQKVFVQAFLEPS